jgi:hypothetical protein
MYKESLHESFPFIDAIKTQEPYSRHLQKLERNFEELHRSMAPPPAPAPAPAPAPSEPEPASSTV